VFGGFTDDLDVPNDRVLSFGIGKEMIVGEP
jgi:hypothetical protein